MATLWYCLSDESRARLAKVQWRNHRKKLLPPGAGGTEVVKTQIESTEEIEKLMRLPAHDHRLRKEDA